MLAELGKCIAVLCCLLALANGEWQIQIYDIGEGFGTVLRFLNHASAGFDSTGSKRNYQLKGGK